MTQEINSDVDGLDLFSDDEESLDASSFSTMSENRLFCLNPWVGLINFLMNKTNCRSTLQTDDISNQLSLDFANIRGYDINDVIKLGKVHGLNLLYMNLFNV